MYLPKRQHTFGQNKVETKLKHSTSIFNLKNTLQGHCSPYQCTEREHNCKVLTKILSLMFVFDVSDHRCWSLRWSMFGSHQRKMSSLVNTSTSLHFQRSIRINSLYHVNHMMLRREVWSQDTCYISMSQNIWGYKK